MMAAVSRSTKAAPSLVVAASVGAVEALKDQAGLCRWDYALRRLYHRAAAAPRIRALSARLLPAAERCGRASSADARVRKAYHLVCWGPN